MYKDIFLRKFFYIVLDYTSSKRRSTNSEVFHKIGIVKNFVKFARKHLYQSLFLNKFAL